MVTKTISITEDAYKALVIGDIHGCFTEFQELLDKAAISSKDKIIALGDILDRGPSSPEVLDFFMAHDNAVSLMGNHERKHVRSFHGEINPALSQIITREQLGDRYPQVCAYINRFPRFLELPEAVLVHGFFEPRVPLAEQQEIVLVGTMSGQAYLQRKYEKPWYELYDGNKPLIAGHLSYMPTAMPLIYKDRVYCIDTGCCSGGALTGILLPDFKIISVKSHKNYWAEIKGRYKAQSL